MSMIQNSSQNVPVAEVQQVPVARYNVIHQTDYNYQSVVTLSQQYLHLTPRNFNYQHTVAHQIHIDPLPDDCNESFDYFGNATRNITLTTPHQILIVRAESQVELYARPDPDMLAGSPPWENLQRDMSQSQGATNLEPFQFLFNSPHVQCGPNLQQYALQSFTPGRPLLEAALALTQRITDEFEFDPDATNIHTTLEEVVQGRRGVCQDFAHLMIGCLRSIGLPARYVSGYILTHPSEGQARLIGADASHAWVSLYSPALGWIDFDPTNRCLVQHEHITLGWGRDFSDVTPLRGIVLGGGQQLLGVSVTVTPLQDLQNTLL
jgi:transglutaminase-like putative cysteine protease